MGEQGSTLAVACSRRPFSNGTEGEAWMACWCDVCAHDHNMHAGEANDGGCDLILLAMLPEFPSADFPWPEAWLPAPTGSFALPSKMICGQYKPCTEGGCCGDPGADERPARVAEVTAYWIEHR